MRIIDRYLLQNLLGSFLAVLLVLLLVSFGSEASRLLAMAVDGRIQEELVFRLLWLKIPPALEIVLPLVALISVMLTFARLYQDQEMMVLMSCGVPPQYFQKLVLIFILPIALFAGFVSLYWAPWSYQMERQITEASSVDSPLAGIDEGRFNKLGSDGVLYARKIDELGNMQDVWIRYDSEKASQSFIVSAPQGRFLWRDSELVLQVRDGWRYQGFLDSHNQSFDVQKFAVFEAVLPEITPAKAQIKKRELDSLTLFESDDVRKQADLQWRLVLPLSVIALALLALKLSKTSPRQGRFAKMFLGLIVYFVYTQLLTTAKNAMADGDIPLWTTLFWMPLVLIVIALWLPKSRLKLHKKSPKEAV